MALFANLSRKFEIFSIANIRRKVRALRNAIRKGLLKLVRREVNAITTADYADETFDAINKSNRRKNRAIFRKVFGKKTDDYLDPPDINKLKRSFRAENTRLIKAMTRKYRDELKEAVKDNDRKRMRRIAKNIDSHAKLIGRDQALKLNGSLNKIRHESFGITEYEWITQRDDRVRKTHNDNDRKIFKWNAPPKSTGHPGHDINCRCNARPVFGVIGFNKK